MPYRIVKGRGKIRKTLSRWLPVAVFAAASLGTAGSGLGIWSSHVERMSHFRLWWIGLLFFLVILFLRERRRFLSGAAVAVLVAAALPLIPYWWRRDSPLEGGGAPFKVIAWNVLHENYSDREEAVRWLRDQQADLILLTECTASWREAVSPLHPEFPYRVSSGRDGAEGMLLLSRYPLGEPDPRGLSPSEAKPWISTLVHLPAGRVRVIGLHPRTPRSGKRFDLRNAQYRTAADIARNSDLPVLLLGDLNCSPFSPWFRHLVREGDLVDTARGCGFVSTWHGQGIGLPIDHVLASKDWLVLDRRVHREKMGSDHRPVVVTLGLGTPRT